ncbi:MAG: IPT/TIG domain-containing protein, partial [Bacteroidia bacterium]|nr:IPT/TIG domain-containing protein [Bacteroidia bacterium]
MRTPLLIKIHTFLVVCCLSIMCANAQVTGMPTGYITITPTISTSAAPVWYNMMATNTDAARVNRYMYYDGTSLKTDLFNAPGITDALQHDKYMWRLEQGGTGASYVLFVNKSTGKRIYADAGIASNGVLTMAVSGIEWKMAAASTVTTGTVAGQYCFDFLPSIRYLNAGDATTSWGILVFNGAASPAKSSGWFFYPVTTTKTVTFAQAANGTIALTATNGTATPSTLTTGNAVVVGTVTTVAITAATGYRLGTLTVNGTDVTAQVTNSSYSFPVNVNATVAATFTLNTPTITSFTPTLQRNGSSVTITGTYFTGATAVSFGGTAATSYTVNSNTQITATVGAGTSGNVSVTNPLGTGSLAGFVWSPVVCYDGGTSGANNFWLTHFYYAKCTDYVGSNTKEVAGSDYLDYNGGSNINFT